jgi:protein SCO1/2
MTMAFKVKERGEMTGRTPGELIRATLVVEEAQGYLSDIAVTGRAPLTAAPPAARGDRLEPGAAVPDVEFTDQDGTARRLSDWRGRVVAVTFIYTRCPLPNFCPLMDRQFAAVQRQVSADPRLRASVHLVSVTLDPAFDTPAVLLSHARGVGADPEIWSFVTGHVDQLDAFGAKFGVSVIRDDPREVAHNLRTAVIDRGGRLTKVFGGNEWTPADLLTEMKHAGAGE